ncbi:MAG: hypothetical protein Q7K65_01600 [Candidatus Buchananbacteria bacterium]|nr:hypothetical protein [Candidatus Buchananbacteria bacterium]
MWNFGKIVVFVSGTVAIIFGLLFRLMPEHQEVFRHLFFTSVAIGSIPFLILLFGCVIWLVESNLFFLYDLVRQIRSWRYWQKERNWGYVFTVPGVISFIAMLCFNGPEIVNGQPKASFGLALLWAVGTFIFLGLGWLINHWPTSTRNRIVRDWSLLDSK